MEGFFSVTDLFIEYNGNYGWSCTQNIFSVPLDPVMSLLSERKFHFNSLLTTAHAHGKSTDSRSAFKCILLRFYCFQRIDNRTF